MMLTLFRVDAKGFAHYYSFHDRQGHFFSAYTLTVSWGRNMISREKVYEFETHYAMDFKIKKILREKIGQGYRILYSYLRPDEHKDFYPLLKKYAAM
jgi:predicted DNA-binding WGR domain protein